MITFIGYNWWVGGSGPDEFSIGNDTASTTNDTFQLGGYEGVGGVNNGFDTFDGGAGTDRIWVASKSGYVWTAIMIADDGLHNVETIYSANAFIPIFFEGNVSFEDVTTMSSGVKIFGRGGDNTFTGGVLGEYVEGDAGNDTLYGNGGDDILYGDTTNANPWRVDVNAAGDDTLYGGDGNDKLYGQGGDDTLYGDAGSDELSGGAGVDLLSGGDGIDYLYGDAGNDTLFGDAGDDQLYGGDGNDVLSGGGGNDVLSGGDGNDLLSGDDGIDSLYGGAGSDYLFAGAGNDFVTGGSGADFFWFNEGEGTNIVTDFTDGTDKIVIGAGVVSVNLYDLEGEALLVLDDTYVLLAGVSTSLIDGSDLIFA